MYSKCIYTCPYYAQRDKLGIRCEGGALCFHDGKATSEYAARYCCADWSRCTIAAELNRYYERQEKEDEEIRRDQEAQT